MDGSYYASSNQTFCGGLIRDSLSVPIAISTSKDYYWDGFSCGGLYHPEIKISTSLFCYDHLLLISGSICLWRIETLLSLIFIKRLIWVLIFLENLGHQDNFFCPELIPVLTCNEPIINVCFCYFKQYKKLKNHINVI